MEFKKMVEEVLAEVDPKLSFHDFRIVEGQKQINLIFDLVVPRDYDGKKKQQLKDEITEKVAKRDSRCCLVMTTESGFGVES